MEYLDASLNSDDFFGLRCHAGRVGPYDVPQLAASELNIVTGLRRPLQASKRYCIRLRKFIFLRGASRPWRHGFRIGTSA